MLWTVTVQRRDADPVVFAVDAEHVSFSPHAGNLWIYGETGNPHENGEQWEAGIVADWTAATAHPAPETAPDPNRIVTTWPEATMLADGLLTAFGYKPPADPATRKSYKPGEEIDPAVKPVAGTLLVDKDGGKWVAAGVYARRHEGREWVLLRHLCRDLGPVIVSEDDPEPEDDGGVDTRTVIYPAGLKAAALGAEVIDEDGDTWAKKDTDRWEIIQSEYPNRIGFSRNSESLHRSFGPITLTGTVELPL